VIDVKIDVKTARVLLEAVPLYLHRDRDGDTVTATFTGEQALRLREIVDACHLAISENEKQVAHARS
jgi:hypothetical protein